MFCSGCSEKRKKTKTNQNKCHALVTSAQALAGTQDVTAQWLPHLNYDQAKTTTNQDRTTTKTYQATVQSKAVHRISEYTALLLCNYASTISFWMQIWQFDSGRIRSNHGKLHISVQMVFFTQSHYECCMKKRVKVGCISLCKKWLLKKQTWRTAISHNSKGKRFSDFQPFLL